jgi:DNA-binding NarL/FixJ family response regulator
MSLETGKRRIFLVDDHPMVRLGLSQMIDGEQDLVTCGQAGSAREAMEKLPYSSPDAAIIDISLGDRNGVELIKDILARLPNLPCLALSMYDDSLYAIRVLRAGGRGYLMKQAPAETVLQAIRRVLDGHVYVGEAMATKLVDQFVIPATAPLPIEQLSDREMEVLTLFGRGQGTREIAEHLILSVKTVEAHRERIKEKLKLRSSTELVRYAVQYTLDSGGAASDQSAQAHG